MDEVTGVKDINPLSKGLVMNWYGNKFHNEYGCIAGMIVERGMDSYGAYCPADTWIGDYITAEHAQKAVEHCYTDPMRLPYPLT